MKIEIDGASRVLVKEKGKGELGGVVDSTWACDNAEQAERLLPTLRERAGRASQLSVGDESAIRDAANEYRKQHES